MAFEDYPLSTHLKANAIYGGVGAVLGTIVWAFAFPEDKWWHGTVGGAVIGPGVMYLAPLAVTMIYPDFDPEEED